MEPQDLIKNEVIFRQTLVDVGITTDDISKAKSYLYPPSCTQIEEHVRLWELLNYSSILKERGLEHSPAAETYKSVMTLYLKAIPELVPRGRWN